MASKFRKLFGKKNDGYYEGPDLLSASTLPTRDPRYPLGHTSLRSKGGMGQYWQDFDAEPSAAYATVRIPRLSSRPYDASTPAPAGQQSGLPSGYRAASRLASFTSSSHSPDFLSHSSASSPEHPLFPRRRINYVDLLDATNSSERSNSSLSYQTQRTSQYNEDIAERNGIEGVVREADAFNPTHASVKYQEHVADRNIRFNAGSSTGEHQDISNTNEALPELSRSPDSASIQSKVASPERPGTSYSTADIHRPLPPEPQVVSPQRPGTSYSSAEIYRPPPPVIQHLHEQKDGIAEKSVRRSSSVLSNKNKPSQQIVEEDKSHHLKKSLPDTTTKLPTNGKAVETVGIAISTDQSWLQKPYQAPLASTNRRSSRRILDLTVENNLVEIIPYPLKTSHQNLDDQINTTHHASNHASQNIGGSLHAPGPPVLRVKTAIEKQDPSNTLNGAPISPYDADEETTPRPAISRSNSEARTKDPTSHDLPHQRSIETLRKKRSLQFSSANIYNPNDDLFPPPFNPSQIQSRLPTLPSMSSIHHATPAPSPCISTNPLAPSRTRPSRADTAPSMRLPPQFQFHRREPTNFSVNSTPVTTTQHQPFSYAPEGSLYNDNTLLLPGLDASQVSADDDFALLSGGRSPGPSTEVFDTMIDSFQNYSQGLSRGHITMDSGSGWGSGSGSGLGEQSRPSTSGGKSQYSIPPFQVPRRDSSLKAVLGGAGTDGGYFDGGRV
jgi:hypothetical protein